MKNNNIQMIKAALFVLLLALTGMTNAFAQEFTEGKLKYTILHDHPLLDEKNDYISIWVTGHVDGDEAKGDIIIPEAVSWEGKVYPVSGIWSAFGGCSGLTSVIIPTSVKIINDYAFSGCSGLTSITIPNSVETIGAWAFSGCANLTSIEIPSSVTYIDGYAFEYCTKLASITLPQSTLTILNNAFNNTKWYNEQSDGVLYLDDCCMGYKGEKPRGHLQINDGTRLIAKEAFYDCSELTSIYLPNSMTGIGASAFEGCSELTSITIPKTVHSIGNRVFNNTGWYNAQPNGILYLDYCCVGYKGNRPRGHLQINDGTRVIASEAFLSCTELTSITIPNSLTIIGRSAFYNCNKLTSISIPNSVTSIGGRAFECCSGLASITIPNSVTSIGDRAFYYCTGLTSVTIPNSVTSIGESAFERCIGLTSISIPNSVTSIGDRAFCYCTRLTSVSIPNSATTMGTDVFKGCTNLIIENRHKTAIIGSDNLKMPEESYAQRWIDMGIRDEMGNKIYWADADFAVFKDGSSGLADYGEAGSLVGWGDVTGVVSGDDLSNYGGNTPPLKISGDSRYDIVSANLGEKYRLPTNTEFYLLIENCDIEFKTIKKQVVGLGGLPSWVQGEWMWHSSDMINGKTINVSINLRIDGYLASVYTSEKEYWEGTYSYDEGVLSVWKLDLLIDDINKTIRDSKGYQFRKISDNTKTSKTNGFLFKSRINGNTLFFVMPSSMTMGTNGSAVISWENPQEYDYWTGSLYPEDKRCAIIFRQNRGGHGMMAIPRFSHCRIRPVKIDN